MQELIKQWGQARGFRAVIEEALPSGGRVDVSLKSGKLSLACEVAMNTTVDQEQANIEKCLAADFQHVLVVSLRKPFLKQLAAGCAERLAEENRTRVKFFSPEELLSFLDDLATESTEQRVAGYAVRGDIARGVDADQQARSRTIAGVIARSVRRLRGSGT